VDEVDSIAGKRSEDEHEASRRLKNQFFQEMEGIKGDSGVNVVVIGATNFPWQLDPAMRRRFEKRVYIPLPSQKDIVYMLKRSLDKVGHSVKGSQFTEIAKKLVGYSGSDVASFVKQCCMVPLDKTARATHFKQCNVDGDDGWVCCDSNERGAQMVDVSDIGGSNIFPPLVEYQDCIESIANCKPSVGQEDLKKYKSFTKEFGMEG
jgi:vacuolar protein-sorting-associated protein 4